MSFKLHESPSGAPWPTNSFPPLAARRPDHHEAPPRRSAAPGSRRGSQGETRMRSMLKAIGSIGSGGLGNQVRPGSETFGRQAWRESLWICSRIAITKKQNIQQQCPFPSFAGPAVVDCALSGAPRELQNNPPIRLPAHSIRATDARSMPSRFASWRFRCSENPL